MSSSKSSEAINDAHRAYRDAQGTVAGAIAYRRLEEVVAAVKREQRSAR